MGKGGLQSLFPGAGSKGSDRVTENDSSGTTEAADKRLSTRLLLPNRSPGELDRHPRWMDRIAAIKRLAPR